MDPFSEIYTVQEQLSQTPSEPVSLRDPFMTWKQLGSDSQSRHFRGSAALRDGSCMYIEVGDTVKPTSMCEDMRNTLQTVVEIWESQKGRRHDTVFLVDAFDGYAERHNRPRWSLVLVRKGRLSCCTRTT